jgi:uncharacterized protein (DUF302 family)
MFLLPSAFALLIATAAQASSKWPYPGTNVVKTSLSFDTLWQRLEAAVTANKMGIVTRASASRGAAGRDITIPGNAVIGVYRNDFAVRMLKASVSAGIEAPLRFYVTENADGTANLTYRTPSAVFAPYSSAELDVMARELDGIFAAIAREAAGK